MEPLREIDYTVYKLKGNELRDYYIVSCCGLFMLGWLFYRSIVLSVLICGFSYPLKSFFEDMKAARIRTSLLEGFKDFLYSLSSLVSAGHQLPEATELCRNSLVSAYGDDAPICRELGRIVSEYKELHGSQQALWEDFAQRSGLSEIKLFASSCGVCIKNGGDLEDMAVKTGALILDKLSFQAEIDGLRDARKLDLIMLASMPVAILLFLNICSYSYISVLYSCLTGRLIMTLSLLGIGAAVLWSLKIIDITL